MFRIDTENTVDTLPTATASGTTGYFSDGDTETGTNGTTVSADWLNSVQEEICHAIEAGGLVPTKGQYNQLAASVSGIARSSASDSVEEYFDDNFPTAFDAAFPTAFSTAFDAAFPTAFTAQFDVTFPTAFDTRFDSRFPSAYATAIATTLASQVQFSDGSVSAPSMAFSSDTDTGIYRFGSNILGIACGGSAVISFRDSSGDKYLRDYGQSTSAFYIQRNVTDGLLNISAGITATTGGNVMLYGGSHATLANKVALRQGATEALSITGTQLVTIGASGGGQYHVVNGLGVSCAGGSASTFEIYKDTTNGALFLEGGTGSANSAQIRLYGSSHATLANYTRFYSNGTLNGFINADGLWTLGPAGSSVTHVLNGSLSISGVASLAAGSASAPSMTFTGDTDTGIYRSGANTVGVAAATYAVADFGGSSTQRWVQFGMPAGGDSIIYCGAADGILKVSSSTASASGGNLWMYGQNHASVSKIALRQGATEALTVTGSALVTIGASGGGQTHVINGNKVQVNSAAAIALDLARSASSAIGMTWTNGAGAMWSGIGSSAHWQVRQTDNAGAIYIDADTSGLVTIGASGGTQTHVVNGSATTIGALGVGGAVSTAAVMNLGATNPLSGTSQYGAYTGMKGTSAATSNIAGFYAATSTSAAAYTCGSLSQFLADGTVTKGAGSTITRSFGFRFTMPDQGSTSNIGICDAGGLTASGNYGIYLATTNPSYFAGPLRQVQGPQYIRNDNANSGTLGGLGIAQGYRKLTSASAKTLTSIQAGADGQVLILQNSGGNLTINNEDGSVGDATLRITTGTGGNVTITGDGVVTFIYDTGSSRWIIVSINQ